MSLMRLPSTVVAAFLIWAGAAQAEDRFGPSPAALAGEQTAIIFDSAAALRWSGKTQPLSAVASDIRTLQSTPLAGGLLRNTSAAPEARFAPEPAVAAQPAPLAAAHPRFPPTTPVAQVAAPMAQAAPVAPPTPQAPLPTSLFDAAPEAVEAPAVAPARPRQTANAANPNAPVGSRLYSVHSDYGMTVDPIPLAQTGVGQ